MNIYIIDSSSLIEMKLKYPEDIFQSLWVEMEKLCEKGRLIAPEEVRKEIEEGDDELKKWMKGRKKIFFRPSKSQLDLVSEVLEKFPFLSKSEKTGPNADPWLISLAIERNNTDQEQFFPSKYIVVTEESKAKKERIPAVCQSYNIECINLIELFRREEWKF